MAGAMVALLYTKGTQSVQRGRELEAAVCREVPHLARIERVESLASDDVVEAVEDIGDRSSCTR